MRDMLYAPRGAHSSCGSSSQLASSEALEVVDSSQTVRANSIQYYEYAEMRHFMAKFMSFIELCDLMLCWAR